MATAEQPGEWSKNFNAKSRAARPSVDEHVIRPSKQRPTFQIGQRKRQPRPEITDEHRKMVKDWVQGVTENVMNPEQKQKFNSFFEQHAQRTPELWRGITGPEVNRTPGEQDVHEHLGLSSWSEDPRVAHGTFAAGNQGQIRHLPRGLARGIRVQDYHDSGVAKGEQEWIVRPGMFHDRRAKDEVDPTNPNSYSFTPMHGGVEQP